MTSTPWSKCPAEFGSTALILIHHGSRTTESIHRAPWIPWIHVHEGSRESLRFRRPHLRDWLIWLIYLLYNLYKNPWVQLNIASKNPQIRWVIIVFPFKIAINCGLDQPKKCCRSQPLERIQANMRQRHLPVNHGNPCPYQQHPAPSSTGDPMGSPKLGTSTDPLQARSRPPHQAADRLSNCRISGDAVDTQSCSFNPGHE